MAKPAGLGENKEDGELGKRIQRFLNRGLDDAKYIKITRRMLAETAGVPYETLIKLMRGNEERLKAPIARNHVLLIIKALHSYGVLSTVEEADSLLLLIPPKAGLDSTNGKLEAMVAKVLIKKKIPDNFYNVQVIEPDTDIATEVLPASSQDFSEIPTEISYSEGNEVAALPKLLDVTEEMEYKEISEQSNEVRKQDTEIVPLSAYPSEPPPPKANREIKIIDLDIQQIQNVRARKKQAIFVFCLVILISLVVSALIVLRPPISILKSHTESVRSIAFNKNGTTLVSASWDETLKLWDVQNRKEIKTLLNESQNVLSVAYNQDYTLLAVGTDGDTIGKVDIKILDGLKGTQLYALKGHVKGVNTLAFNPSGTILASGSSDSKIDLWDIVNRKQLKQLEGHVGTVWSVAFKPNTTDNLLVSGGLDGKVIIWDLDAGKPIKILTAHSKTVYSIAFSPDGNIMATGSEDQTIRFWNTITWEEIGNSPASDQNGTIKALAFSPNGKTFVSGGNNNSVILWDVKSHEKIKVIGCHSGGITDVKFSPDGSLIASASNDKTIRIWKLNESSDDSKNFDNC